MMKPRRLTAGDTIGVIAPCGAAEDGCMEAPAHFAACCRSAFPLFSTRTHRRSKLWRTW